MSLYDYLSAERGRVAKVARKAGIAATHLWQIAAGRRPAPPWWCPAIETACDMQVRRWHLRPKDWHRIWPELVGADGAPQPPTAQAVAVEVAVDAA